ncbi:MAG TPA: thiamine phosphate synthase [Terriglobales bacterium]|nr:thiamine phosphate synthase [Terriglobales bacterium]
MLLYYITDRKQLAEQETERRQKLLAKIEEAAAASIGYIQLRERDLNTRELERLAGEAVAIVKSCRSASRLLVNSRTDVAIASGASGVHLRSDDVSPRDVRAVFERAGLAKPVIAVSCHSLANVGAAESDGADLATFGPVYGKLGSPASLGIEALRSVCHRTVPGGLKRMPVFALGGVTVDNAFACAEAGASGVAAIRMFQENEIATVVSKLRDL